MINWPGARMVEPTYVFCGHWVASTLGKRGLGGSRVMNTCTQMGVATSYAAVLCNQHGTTPRQVGQTHVQQHTMIGYLSNRSNNSLYESQH